MTNWGVRTAFAAVGAVAMCLAAVGTATAAPAEVRPAVTAGIEAPAQPPGLRCFQATGTYHERTLFGNTFYRLHHTAHWCSDGRNVVGVHVREHRVTDQSAFAQVEGEQANTLGPLPAREVRSFVQLRVDNNLPNVGVISTTYPWVELTLRADGTWSEATGRVPRP